jgi:hypothetical protein
LFSSLLRCVAATVSRFTFTSQLRAKDLPIALSARYKRLIETQQNARHNNRRQESALTFALIPCPRHNPQKTKIESNREKKRSLKLRLHQSKLIRSDPNPQPKRRRLNLRKQTISQAATSAVGLIRSDPIFRSSPKPTKMKIEDYNKTKDLSQAATSAIELS